MNTRTVFNVVIFMAVMGMVGSSIATGETMTNVQRVADAQRQIAVAQGIMPFMGDADISRQMREVWWSIDAPVPTDTTDMTYPAGTIITVNGTLFATLINARTDLLNISADKRFQKELKEAIKFSEIYWNTFIAGSTVDNLMERNVEATNQLVIYQSILRNLRKAVSRAQ